jgi:hypothetical protein
MIHGNAVDEFHVVRADGLSEKNMEQLQRDY